MSGERGVWEKVQGERKDIGVRVATEWHVHDSSDACVAICATESDAGQIVREHNAYQDAVAALEIAEGMLQYNDEYQDVKHGDPLHDFFETLRWKIAALKEHGA